MFVSMVARILKGLIKIRTTVMIRLHRSDFSNAQNTSTASDFNGLDRRTLQYGDSQVRQTAAFMSHESLESKCCQLSFQRSIVPYDDLPEFSGWDIPHALYSGGQALDVRPGCRIY